MQATDPPKGFETLQDIDSDVTWVAKEPMTDSDWPVWFFIKILYMEYYSQEWVRRSGCKYHCEVIAAAPEAVGEEERKRAADSYGLSAEDYAELDDKQKAHLLVEYGIKATLWQESGNNMTKLKRMAMKELAVIRMLFGFYMDRPQNLLGNTGWDWISGRIGLAAGSDVRKRLENI